MKRDKSFNVKPPDCGRMASPSRSGAIVTMKRLFIISSREGLTSGVPVGGGGGGGGGGRIKERTPPGPRIHGRLRGARQRPLEDAFLTGGRMSSGEKGQKADLHWILPGDDITWPYEIK